VFSLKYLNTLNKILRCPVCFSKLIIISKTNVQCSKCKNNYSIEEDIPILKTTKINNELSFIKWKEYYNDYDFNRNYIEYSKHIKYILKYVDKILVNRKIILEIGSGPSFLSFEMAKQGKIVICFDSNLNILIKAKHFFKKNNIKGYFVCGDLLVLPFKNNFCDFIYGGGVIEHVRETNHCVSELYRVLKRGGAAMSTVPCVSFSTLTYYQRWGNIPDIPVLGNIFEFIHLQLMKGKHMVNGYEKSFTVGNLFKIFSKNRFKQIKIGLFDFDQGNNAFDNKSIIGLLCRKYYKYRLFWNVVYILASKQ
jgi:ubiquinone/menaquinone biosynthesis C-methylase UbiE/uncharacterized protein YbaR (Trm112 family)